jgi:hypothetical protein
MSVVRLHNSSTTVISCNLMGWTPRQRNSMRRGVLMTPVAIQPGRSLDVGRHLGLSYEEALLVLTRSPEVKAFQAKGMLQVLGAEPAPAVPSAPVAPIAPSVEPQPAELPVPSLPVLPEDVIEEESESSESSEGADAGEPSMTWTNKQLRLHAESMGLDTRELKSKTMLLRAIHEAIV